MLFLPHCNALFKQSQIKPHVHTLELIIFPPFSVRGNALRTALAFKENQHCWVPHPQSLLD